jgi:Holliday junction resolvase RusA-like endonuclease
MDRSVTIDVEGLPPKKDGANSMWTKATESRRVLALRLRAAAAMAGRTPLEGPVEVELAFWIGPTNSRRMGDLDNYITGVLDSLQAIAERARWEYCSTWTGVPDAVSPTQPIVLKDDNDVMRLVATKHCGPDAPHYSVTVRQLA